MDVKLSVKVLVWGTVIAVAHSDAPAARILARVAARAIVMDHAPVTADMVVLEVAEAAVL